MKALINRFVREESGQDLVEYALLLGIITLASIAAIQSIGSQVASIYQAVDTNLQTVGGGS